jgi:hypothetical protein
MRATKAKNRRVHAFDDPEWQAMKAHRRNIDHNDS